MTESQSQLVEYKEKLWASMTDKGGICFIAQQAMEDQRRSLGPFLYLFPSFPLSWLHLIQDFPSQWEDGSQQLQSLYSLSTEYNREEQKSVSLKS